MKLSNSNHIGIPRINGNTNTPLVPKFLIYDDYDNRMTSYLNKRKNIYYYKCSQCNKTANANTRTKSLHKGLNQHFIETIDSLKFSKEFHQLFSKQLEKIIDSEMINLTDSKRIIKKEIKELQNNHNKIEFRYATGVLSQEIYEKHGIRLKTLIEKKTKQLQNQPSKRSNHTKFLKKFLKIAENPCGLYKY